MMKTIILLGGGTEAIPIIFRARDLGYRAVVVDGNPEAPGRDVGDDFVCASCYHADQAIEALRRHQRSTLGRYDGVLCAAVDAPVAAAEIAAEFGLPGLSVEAARLGQNKLAQKWRLRNAGIPVPSFAFMGGEVVISLEPITNPVVKPVDSRGGRGVVRLLPGVDPAWAYEQAKAHSPTGRVMIEQWLDGPQVSTESIIQDGRVMFTAAGLRNYDKLDEYKPYVVENGFDEPFGEGVLPMMTTDSIDTVIESACRALGWYQSGAGTVKGDLVIHDGRVYIIELAARLSGGFFATHGHPHTYGVDFVGMAIKAALGYQLDAPLPYARGCVSQRYVFPALADIGRTIKEIAPAIETDSYLDWSVLSTWNIKAGDVVQPVTCHPARWGQALATGRTPEGARRRAEAAASAMKAAVILE